MYNNIMSSNRKRRQLTNRKKQLLIVNAFLVLFFFIGIGYSRLSTNLNVEGELLIKKRPDPIIAVTSADDRRAFKSNTYRDNIRVIYLDDEINPPEGVIESWDVGVAQNGNVMAYIVADPEEHSMYDLYIQGSGHLYANEDSKYLFAYLHGVDSIVGLSKLDVSRVVNMHGMFQELGFNSWYFTIDLGPNFDTSNVTDMGSMFMDMGFVSNFLTLDLGDKFYTNKVTDMSYMFDDCGYNSPVFTLDLGSNFDTSNVIYIQHLFCCAGQNSQVYTLDLGDKFDTSNAVNMQNMFNYAGYSNTNFTIDLGNLFDTSKVTDMSYMFSNARYLTTIYVTSSFVTTNVTDSTNMFTNDSQLVGGMGTTYRSEYNDKTYARIDGGTSIPGYFTDRAVLSQQQQNSTNNIEDTMEVPSNVVGE